MSSSSSEAPPSTAHDPSLALSHAASALHWKPALRLLAGGLAFAALLWASAMPCLFAAVTRLPCPGCGSTRSVHALVRGDLHGVLHFNPFGPVVAALLGALGCLMFGWMLRDGDLQRFGRSRLVNVLKCVLFAVAILQFALWIARFFGVLDGPVSV